MSKKKMLAYGLILLMIFFGHSISGYADDIYLIDNKCGSPGNNLNGETSLGESTDGCISLIEDICNSEEITYDYIHPIEDVNELTGLENSSDFSEGSGGFSFNSWGSDYMGFSVVKENETFRKKGPVTIALIDSGVNVKISEFENRISSDSVNMFDGSTDITDENGHGTHMAGIIVNSTPENVRLLVVKAVDKKGKTEWDIVNKSIEYAVEKGADIINLSLGVTKTGEPANYDQLDEMLKYAAKQGVLVVCSAGNKNIDVSHTYPACSDMTIAVSAINKAGLFSDKFDSFTGSSYGEKVDFCAPGKDIASFDKNGNLIKKSGTSCSTAFVSAGLACIKAVFPDLPGDEIYKLASENAKDLGDAGKDIYYGNGCIDLSFLEDKLINPKELISATTLSVSPFSKGFKLSWDAVENATGYLIYRSKNGGSYKKLANIEDGLAISYMDMASKTNGAKYQYRIVPYIRYKGKIYKNSDSLATTAYSLSVPKVSSVTSTKEKTFTVKATGNSESTGIEIEYSLNKDFKKSASVRAKKKGFATINVTKLKKGRTYYVRARVYKKVGKHTYVSAWTTVKKVKIE